MEGIPAKFIVPFTVDRVQVWALDPKRMELSFGRDLFTRLIIAPARAATETIVY